MFIKYSQFQTLIVNCLTILSNFDTKQFIVLLKKNLILYYYFFFFHQFIHIIQNYIFMNESRK